MRDHKEETAKETTPPDLDLSPRQPPRKIALPKGPPTSQFSGHIRGKIPQSARQRQRGKRGKR